MTKVTKQKLQKRKSFQTDFTFDKDQNCISYKKETFVYQSALRDSTVFRCQVKGCVATIKIDKSKTKILGGKVPTHTSHDRPSLQSRLSTPSTPNTQTVRRGARENNSVSIKNNAQVPNTRVATPNHDDQPVPSVGINTTLCSKSSGPGAAVENDNLADSLKKQIVELKMLQEAMIEQLIDKEKTVLTKERIIQEKEKTIELLMRQIHDMEIELKQKSPSSLSASVSPNPKTQHQKKTKSRPTSKYTATSSDLVKSNNLESSSVGDNITYLNKCSLIGDSHCRGMGYYLRRYLNRVETFFKPGSGFVGIRDSSTVSMSNMMPDDKIVYLCGTNDVPDRNWCEAFKAVDQILDNHQAQHLCFILVPIRWDCPQLNNRVQKFNNLLRDKLRTKHISYLDPNYFLRPWHYAKDGLHLNINGKRLLSLKIKYHFEKASVLCEHPMLESRVPLTDGHEVSLGNVSVSVPSNVIPTCNKSKQTLCNSFQFDQSYSYDLSGLNLMNNVPTPSPNINSCTVFPTLPITTPSIPVGDLSPESTFTLSPRTSRAL